MKEVLGAFQAEVTSRVKAPGQVVGGTARRLHGWNRVREGRVRGGEGRKGVGQVMQDLVHLGEDLGFYWRKGGVLEGCGQRMDQT